VRQESDMKGSSGSSESPLATTGVEREEIKRRPESDMKSVGDLISDNKLTDAAFCMPRCDEAVVNLNCKGEKSTTCEEIREVMEKCSVSDMTGFWGCCAEPPAAEDLAHEGPVIVAKEVASTTNEEYEAWLEDQQWQLEVELEMEAEPAASTVAPTLASHSGAPAPAPEPVMVRSPAEICTPSSCQHPQTTAEAPPWQFSPDVASPGWPWFVDATAMRMLQAVSASHYEMVESWIADLTDEQCSIAGTQTLNS